MAHYVGHGHEPSDDEIARHGYRAFGPQRPAFNPTRDDFRRALGDCATGDPDELGGLAEEMSGLWPGWVWPGFYGYGFGGFLDD